jgi:hypothetical protein
MNKIPIIRKGSIKDYWRSGFGGGIVVGLLVSGLSLIGNPLTSALLFGVLTWIGIIVLFIAVGFTSEEYFIRKKKIQKLYSARYAFLDEHHFTLHPDLYFEGEYKGFHVRVIPVTKYREKGKPLEYDIIEAFYDFDAEEQHSDEKEKKLNGNYYIGNIRFGNLCAGFIPKDWENPDFQESINGLISIFRRENLKPLSKEEWQETYGRKLEEARNLEVKSRTKQILKIGKLLDIRYTRPEKK